jgi:hypothetical protein
MSIERDLKAALAPPPDPGDAFAASVMDRIQRGQQLPARRTWRVPVALAASLVIAISGVGIVQQQERARAERTQQQLLLALAITSEHLNLVQMKLSAPNASTTHQENGT